MTIDELLVKCPRVFHMAHRTSWPSIEKHGLLSTTALLELFEYSGPARSKLESQWRPVSVRIEHPVHGIAWIRDQAVMPDRDLEAVLIGVTPGEWYEFLNRKTFFWGEKRRLQNFLMARNYHNDSHCVITVNTAALVEKHAQEITLCSINSGLVYYGGKRGRHTFKTIADMPRASIVWEVAVEHSVSDITDIIERVELCKRDEPCDIIWEK